MACTYQVILNEQIKAMCLPIKILWILFFEPGEEYLDIHFIAIIILLITLDIILYILNI